MNQVERKKRQVEFASYVLGAISLMIIGNFLGDNGIAYFAAAYESFQLLAILLTYRLEDTLAKLLKNRTGKGQYKNAQKLRKNVVVLGLIFGAAGSLALFAGAGVLGETVLGLGHSVAMIRILAPILFFRTLVTIMLGFFQGEGTELPAVISYVMRQICILLFAILLVKFCGNYGDKVSALLREENFAAMYRGMGYAAAMLLAEILVFLFLAFVYQGSRGRAKKGVTEGMRGQEAFTTQVAAVASNTFPLTLVALLGHLPVWLGFFFFRKSLEQTADVEQYGVFYGKFLPVVAILVLIACIALMHNSYKIAAVVRKDEQKIAKNQFDGGFHFAFVYGLFFAMYLAVMASPVAELSGAVNHELAVKLFQTGSLLIPGLILGWYFSECLLFSNKRYLVVGTAALKSAVFLVLTIVLLRNGAGVLALICGEVIAVVIYASVNGVILFRQLRVSIDLVREIAIPLGTVCVTGLLLWGFGRLLAPHLGSVLAVVLSLVLGFGLQITVLVAVRDFKEQELNYIPGGKFLRAIGQTFRIY
ncbi:MAG: oligosaccharide flippase family protein [Lachnospiraceae bacterium]|nr:oligosaccharide flippase family protein [Lachnospiraceae bacterium]